MTDDPAVEAVADVGLTHGGAYTMPPRPQCRCGFNTVTFAGLREHIAAAYLEAARPIIEAETMIAVANDLDPGVRGTELARSVALLREKADRVYYSRAAVRTEPPEQDGRSRWLHGKAARIHSNRGHHYPLTPSSCPCMDDVRDAYAGVPLAPDAVRTEPESDYEQLKAESLAAFEAGKALVYCSTDGCDKIEGHAGPCAPFGTEPEQ